ncbi:MAG TPA: LytTR family DNA-binding domain-containing protein [Polyangia bacterium]|jgi:two-component system LytT family response regulator|nr:LytTR family DNA-binding domain-containing protein [Polyangia bacterium]
MRVMIVDDEPLAREAIRVVLEGDREITEMRECTGVEAVQEIPQAHPDILFLDVQMPEVDGFEVLERVGDVVPAVIFVTAYDAYALRAFEVHALGYLLKPFSDARLCAELSRAKEQVRARRVAAPFVRRFVIRTRDEVAFVKTEDIDWIEAANYYASLYAGGKTHLIRLTMAEIEKQLDPERFVRVHRSAIVNIDRVVGMQPLFRGDCMLVLRDGTRVRLSRARREEFERRVAR